MYTLLITYGLLSIFISFLCSILEASLLSVTHAFINIKQQEGAGYANQLEKLKEDIDRPLIAILTINTVANTAGALLVGVEAEHVFGSGDNMVFAISFIMTFLILLVSEIIPKTIGATYWKELAKFTTKTLGVFIFIIKYSGLLWLLLFTTRLIGKEEVHGSSVFSREDFHAMTEIAEEEGVFEEQESTVIKNIINFKDTTVNEIMTPRSVMLTANEDQKIIDFYNENKELRFSRIPLYKEDPDDINSYFLKDKLYDAIIKGTGDKPLSTLKRDIIMTNRDTSVAELFETLIEKKEHIALVFDEYGSVSGIVTQEDAIETLLGLEIMDESDRHEDMQQLAKKQHQEREDELNHDD
jgi:CBS domain containing-hemolysin-like protein